jgi:hypothetical protein
MEIENLHREKPLSARRWYASIRLAAMGTTTRRAEDVD